MSSAIEAMKLISDLKRAFKDNGNSLSEEEFDKIIKKLIPSDSDNSIKDNFGRFDKGYSAEILFERIYSLLPWIKLITPLGQEQFPEKSKEEYQVPDYEIIFETGSPEKRAAVLIEAKMVDVKKES